MEYIIVTIALFAMYYLGVNKDRKRRKKHFTDGHNYNNYNNAMFIKKKVIMTDQEIKLYNNLKSIIPPENTIYPKIHLPQVLNVMTGPDYTERFESAIKKHLDFTVCNKETLEPLYIIQLDTSPYDIKDNQIRESYVYKACKSANIPLYIIKDYYIDDLEEIHRIMKEPLI